MLKYLLGIVLSFIFVKGNINPGFLLSKSSDKIFVGYFVAADEKNARKPEDTGLAKLPSYVNIVNIAGMNPSSTYLGDLNLKSCGIDLPYSGKKAKQAIAILKQRNPETKVFISLGAPSEEAWINLNETSIIRLVQDLGLDGVDIDYEPSVPGCVQHDGDVSCKTDAHYIEIIKRLRGALPRPYLLTVAAWSIGAYGQGNFQDSLPKGNYTGLSVNMLRQVGEDLDIVHIMSYDAGNTYDPIEAYRAYSSLYKGKITIGVEVPPEAWGGHTYTMSQVNSLAEFVNEEGAAGLMMWSLQKKPSGPITDDNPDCQLIAQGACLKLGLLNCNDPL